MQDREIPLLFIVYNYDHERCLNTLKSIIRPKNPAWSRVQVVYIPRAQKKEPKDLEKFLNKHAGVITRLRAQTPGESALKQALQAGEEDAFVCITQSGVTYEENLPQSLDKALGQEEEPVYVMPVGGVMLPEYIQQINRYCFREDEPEDFRESYDLPAYGYFVYLFSKKLVPTVIDSEERELYEIWKLLMKMLAVREEIPALGEFGCQARGLKNFPEFWKETVAMDSKTEVFCKEFLEELFLWASCAEGVKLSFVRYNLLRFAVTYASYYQVTPGEEERASAIRVWMEHFIEGLRDESLLVLNTQMLRSHKRYFLSRDTMEVSQNPEIQKRKADILDPDQYPADLAFVTLKKDSLTLEWRVHVFQKDVGQVFVTWQGVDYPAERMTREEEKYWFDLQTAKSAYFRCTIPLGQVRGPEPIHLWNQTEGQRIANDVMNFGKYTPFDKNRFLVYEREGWLLYYEQEKGCLYLEAATPGRRRKLHRKQIRSLWNMGDMSGKKAILIHEFCRILAKCWRKKVWLISDRTNRADDNGEAFFQHLCEHPVEGVQPYYVISKACEDFERMKQYGKVIDVLSWKHKILHLISEYEISSQANNPVINPFGKYYVNYKNLMADRKFVFLQHGVIKDDLSGWLNRYNRSMVGFIVTTRPEWQSILDYDYDYTEKEVWLTGIPRYDKLYHDEKNYVTIMPTWRKSLSAGTDELGVWKVDEEFRESAYFQFYNQLLNSERLLTAAKKYGFQVCFMPHPNVVPALSMFHKREDVEFFGQKKSYREIFAQSNLILTDYSSVAFDFAYLRKPVVYAQFDHDEFFNGGHSYDLGYYDYEKDGFGEVSYNLEDTIDTLISYMERDCKVKPEYLERINRTFCYHDSNCCARVVEKIMEDRQG